MKRVFKNRIFLVVLALVVFTSIGVYAANMISASEVSYNGTTVKDALDALYSSGGSGASTVITGLSSNATVNGSTIYVTATPAATDNNKIVGYHFYLIEKDNNQNISVKMSKDNTVTFASLKPHTKYLYYASAYDTNNGFITSVTNEVETEDFSIVFTDKFDKYIYIDAVNGDDTSGDGTRTNPYKTLVKIAENGIIINNFTYGIILNSGTYELTNKIFELTNNRSINIIGNRQNTILRSVGIYANSGGGSKNYDLNIYRLVWRGEPNQPNSINAKTSMNLYNVAFSFKSAAFSYSYFCPAENASYTFNNCTLPYSSSSMMRTTGGSIKVTNGYGGFSSGYSTSNSNWDYQTNTITSNPQVDTTTYRITDVDEAWKNNGTGENADGGTANRGVYGGAYSWDIIDDIF